MDDLWRAKRLPLDALSARAQLLCLAAYVEDPQQAADLSHAWGALSTACHHHPYEIAPTASELRHWIDTVAAFAATTA
jgi:hypothetical protein